MALFKRIRGRATPSDSLQEVDENSRSPREGSGSDPDPAQTERRKRAEHRRHRDKQYQLIKASVHRKLFDHIDFSKLSEVSESRASSDVAAITRLILEEEKTLFNAEDRQRLVDEIQDEVFGLGPLEPFLQDGEVCDILVNRHDQIYVEREGRLEMTDSRFLDDAHLMRIIERILSQVGRRVDESTPMVDARLADGSRVNVIIPPLALDGPVLSIRRFSEDPLTADRLVAAGSLTDELVTFLQACVNARLNVLIAGGTGSGKTTLLNMLSAFVAETERIVSIEDSAELQLHQEHVVRLETRPANVEGKGQITQRELVINSLRMRPDRIIIGEVRGAEALDMLQAMNTGHDGSLTTIHANSPTDAVMRLETMVAMSGFDIPPVTTRAQIGSAVDLILQVKRFANGARAVTSVHEVTGVEDSIVQTTELFNFREAGGGEAGSGGRLELTGARPSFLAKLASAGFGISSDFFATAPARDVAVLGSVEA